MRFFIAVLLVMASFAGSQAQGFDPLRGKVVCVLGDSYVRNHRRPVDETWHCRVATAHGMDYRNFGRNGGCVAFDRSREGFGPSLLVRYKDMPADADLVLIIAGHNDAAMIGTSRDSLQMFCDSLDLLLTRIHAHCPKARLGWVTPWYVDRPGFRPVVKAIKRICRKHHVPVLDNYRRSCPVKVRDADFRRHFFQGPNDTAHLNAEGHSLFYATGEKFMLDAMNDGQ